MFGAGSRIRDGGLTKELFSGCQILGTSAQNGATCLAVFSWTGICPAKSQPRTRNVFAMFWHTSASCQHIFLLPSSPLELSLEDNAAKTHACKTLENPRRLGLVQSTAGFRCPAHRHRAAPTNRFWESMRRRRFSADPRQPISNNSSRGAWIGVSRLRPGDAARFLDQPGWMDRRLDLGAEHSVSRTDDPFGTGSNAWGGSYLSSMHPRHPACMPSLRWATMRRG